VQQVEFSRQIACEPCRVFQSRLRALGKIGGDENLFANIGHAEHSFASRSTGLASRRSKIRAEFEIERSRNARRELVRRGRASGFCATPARGSKAGAEFALHSARALPRTPKMVIQRGLGLARRLLSFQP
jgi:hypothetical protein